MLVLRLTNSDDFNPAVPPDNRAPAVAAAAFERVTGQPLETVGRIIWPSAELPDIVEAWLVKYRPEIILFRTSSYWCTYESVPIRLRRRYGRAGAMAVRAAERAGESPRLPSTLPFRMGRTLATRVIGGDPHFTPEQVVEVTGAVLRRTLADETITTLVRGPVTAYNAGGGARGAARAARRIQALDSGLEELCGRLHVPYASQVGEGGVPGNRTYFGADRIHRSVQGHFETGTAEGMAMARMWLAAHTGDGLAAAVSG
ncbi:MAG: hypothetical protein IT304_05705 [Dehalococcoidia bacterium]|nr:hypothetical protein [Dehalococcoidia bacterium]